MNMKTNRLIHIEAVETIPVTCPKCAAALGAIDVHNLAQRGLWERGHAPLSIAQPTDPAIGADAGLIRGACPACSAELASFWILYERNCGAGAVAVAPRLSAAMHAATFTGWAIIEHRKNGFDVVEHCFGPVEHEQAAEAYERIREILNDLPRPEAEAA